MQKPESGIDVYNVTRLNREVRAVLEGSFPAVWVEGEISNLARPASGHLYFSLKDAWSQVRCAMFKGRNQLLTFEPENGTSVLVRAGISLYEARGEFQLIVEHMEPAGEGALQRAYEELRQKLFKQGLFEESHKRPVPQMAQRIGLITSPGGAAIRDILSILKRRFPLARIIVYPTTVQGETAAEQIITMLQTAQRRKECDVLILTRGGGSLEDLWAFNNENLAHAIYNCSIPVVSAVGHEIDFTIADFVADIRAATPSAAAEIVSPDQDQLKTLINRELAILVRGVNTRINDIRRTLMHLEKRIPHPKRNLQMISQRLDELHMRNVRSLSALITRKSSALSKSVAELKARNPLQMIRQQQDTCRHMNQYLARAMKAMLQHLLARLEQAGHSLDTISPLATLARGYAIVRQQNGRLVRRADQLQEGEDITARFGKGQAHCVVNRISNEDDT
ncbi:MAG: exodeoxyribonuclease VII large subunit [Gammaproteobacteria bacterium]|nr:exodeoxyribonuclease VII large subunit [Gammaproteobacteria bacterium]